MKLKTTEWSRDPSCRGCYYYTKEFTCAKPSNAPKCRDGIEKDCVFRKFYKEEKS